MFCHKITIFLMLKMKHDFKPKIYYDVNLFESKYYTKNESKSRTNEFFFGYVQK